MRGRQEAGRRAEESGRRPGVTVLCELGGAEDGGDPEGFFGASLEGQVGRQVGAAVEVLFAAGQAQVQALVTEGGVLVALKDGHQEGGGHVIGRCRQMAAARRQRASGNQGPCTTGAGFPHVPCRRTARGLRPTAWFHLLSSEE